MKEKLICILVVLAVIIASIGVVFHLIDVVFDRIGLDKYDHFQYNGVDYYIVDSRLVPDFSEGDTIYFSRRDLPIVYVDDNGDPYDFDETFYAWSYEKDPEMMFLFTGSAVYTRDLELANTVVTD